jgi:hypothetical protein
MILQYVSLQATPFREITVTTMFSVADQKAALENAKDHIVKKGLLKVEENGQKEHTQRANQLIRDAAQRLMAVIQGWNKTNQMQKTSHLQESLTQLESQIQTTETGECRNRMEHARNQLLAALGVLTANDRTLQLPDPEGTLAAPANVLLVQEEIRANHSVSIIGDPENTLEHLVREEMKATVVQEPPQSVGDESTKKTPPLLEPRKSPTSTKTSEAVNLEDYARTIAKSIPNKGTTIGSFPKPTDRYIFTQRLGEGAQGDVFLGQHRELGSDVAIKTTKPAASEREKGRMMSEARTLASLKHPHLVAVHDWFIHQDGMGCIVMELVEGTTLEQEIQTHTPNSRKEKRHFKNALFSLIPIAQALHHVHEKGIIHRDVKPANIMLGQIKLLDLGIAENAKATENELKDAGTPAYMAPEQMQKKGEVGPATDVWGFILTLVKGLTGEYFYVGGLHPATITQSKIDARWERLKQQIPHAGLRAVIEGNLKLNPKHRMQSMEDIAVVLDFCLISKEIGGRAITDKGKMKEKEELLKTIEEKNRAVVAKGRADEEKEEAKSGEKKAKKAGREQFERRHKAETRLQKRTRIGSLIGAGLLTAFTTGIAILQSFKADAEQGKAIAELKLRKEAEEKEEQQTKRAAAESDLKIKAQEAAREARRAHEAIQQQQIEEGKRMDAERNQHEAIKREMAALEREAAAIALQREAEAEKTKIRKETILQSAEVLHIVADYFFSQFEQMESGGTINVELMERTLSEITQITTKLEALVEDDEDDTFRKELELKIYYFINAKSALSLCRAVTGQKSSIERVKALNAATRLMRETQALKPEGLEEEIQMQIEQIFTKTLGVVNKMIAQDKRDPVPHLAKATMLARTNRFEEAAVEIELVLSTCRIVQAANQRLFESYMYTNLAYYYSESFKTKPSRSTIQKAKKACLQALENKPDYKNAMDLLQTIAQQEKSLN